MAKTGTGHPRSSLWICRIEVIATILLRQNFSLTGKMSLDKMTRVLAASAVLEVVIGLVLIAIPGIVVGLLLGASAVSGIELGRFAGIALLALGIACWPHQQIKRSAPAYRGILTYNILVALFLTYLGTVQHFFGWLLWPAAGLHLVIAALLFLI